MQEQLQSPKQGLFFKQYLSFDFAFTKNPKIGCKKTAIFEQRNGGYHRLQPVCYDSYTLRPEVYFVQWEDSQINKNVYIKQEDSEDWCAVELNELPIWIKITNNCAFLVGARQLIIVPLEKKQQPHIIPLEAGQIVDIKYCFEQTAESGIYVVFFDTKRGYYARTYSKTTTLSYWSRIKPYLQLSFSQFSPYEHFQVIIPNILALGFKDQYAFLYDLYSMKEVGLFTNLNHISNNQNFNIKWKLSESTSDYSDMINVFICRKNVIESFMIQINRKKVKIAINGQQIQERVQINRIIAGDIIDWNRTNIMKGELLIETVSNIIDFEINRNQLIYSFLEHTQTYIPTVLIVDLNNSTQQVSQVLSVQNKVYTNFLQSRFKNKGNMQIEQQPIVMSQVNSGKKQIQITKKNQFQNTENNSFCKFLSVGSKFWSIRKTAFLTYQAITELQFVIQKQSEIQDHGIIDINTIDSLSEYRILKISNSLQDYSLQTQINHYKDLLDQMKRSTSRQFTPISQENIAEDYVSNTLFKKLVGNIVKDYILYFNKYAEYNFMVLQMSQVLQQNIAIAKICSFLEDIDFGKQLQKQINQSLFDYYVDCIWNKLINKGELCVGLVFKKLFENILLDHYIKYSQNMSQQNMFLETIIELFLLQKQNQFVIEYLSIVLKKYLAKLSEMQESVFHFIITQNSSVFLAFLLSYPKKQQLTNVFKILYNKKHYQAFKTNLRKVQQLIPNQLQILLELELGQAPIKSKLNYQHFVQFVQKPLMFASMYKKPSKDHIVQEMFLYDNEQRYRQNLSIQKYLLDQIKKAPISSFKDLDSNLVDLSQKQLSFDILKRNNQHILEWEENVLQIYTQLFNEKVKLIEAATQVELKQTNEYLTLILTKIQASVFCYCKFYEHYYNKQQKFRPQQSSSTLEFIKSKILRQQNIMSNSLLQKPLKIYKFILSQFAVKILRNHILQNDTIKVVRERNLLSKENFDQLFELIVRNLLKKEKLRWQDMDTLQYLLTKEGQKKFSKLLKKFQPKNLQNILTFLQEKKDQGYLYGFINNIKNCEEVTVPRYRNPFAVY